MFWKTIVLSCILITASSARELTSLNGEWDFHFGNEPSAKVQVPHTWNAVDGADGISGVKKSALSVQGTGYKRGEAVYERDLPEIKPDKRYFIKGDGAAIISEVLVNGKSAGKHEGSYTAFCYEITPLLQKGNNKLTIKTNNSITDYIAPLAGDFTVFGGLYRPVNLIETDDVCIQPDYFASPGVFMKQTLTNNGKDAELQVNTRISSIKSKGFIPVTLRVMSPQGKIIIDTTKQVEVKPNTVSEESFNLNIKNPELWQARENPALYKVEVSIAQGNKKIDSVVQPLGFRSFEFTPDRGVLLNGKAMQIKGVNRHQDKEGKGTALSTEDELLDMQLIYDMGADGLRTAHYPQTKTIYDFCDSKGIIVWSEVPNVEKVKKPDEFIDNNKLQAKEMVLQLGNHPSIAMWGIYNEIYHQCSPQEASIGMEDILDNLTAHLRKLDPSRPVVAATNRAEKKRLNLIPTLLCANMYPGWYGGSPDSMGGSIKNYRAQYPSSPFGVSEYGAGASIHMQEYPAKQPGAFDYWHPESWQNAVHEGNYKTIKTHPEVWGSFIWNMFDFATDCRNEGEHAGMNDKGLVTYDRKTPKDAYFFYKANWNPELMNYITARRFTRRQIGEIPVKVYSNADEVNLFLNGKSLGKKQPDDLKRVTWEKVTLKEGSNTLKVIAKRKGKTVTDNVTWEYKKPASPVTVDRFDLLKQE